MEIIKQKLFTNRAKNQQAQQDEFFPTEIKTFNFKTVHEPKSYFSKRNSHQNFSTHKNTNVSNHSENKTSKFMLKRASTLKNKDKEREKENIDEKFIKLANENVTLQKSKHYIDEKFQGKEQNNFLFTSQFVQPRESRSYKRSQQKINLLSSAKISPNKQITAESKWEKVIELYTMRDQLAKKYHSPSANHLRRKYPILPSGQFYRIMLKDRVFEKQWKINFPETLFLENQGNVVMIYTDESGVLRKKFIEKEGKEKGKYKEQVMKFKSDLIEALNKSNKMRLFKQYRLESNPNAPLSIMKYTEQSSFQFETDVQSDRNFNERKLRPTRESIVQRYIYSNNMKAMVFRLYYRRHSPGNSSGPEYEGIRFENEKPIFKESGLTNFPEIHKLTSTIMLSDKRINTIKVMPINNLRALEKFIVIGKELQKMLEYVEKTVIDKLYIDFIVDVFDKPWVINIKYCEINPNLALRNNELKQDHIRNVSSCRLCGIVERKQNLKNTVSVRMLCEFIYHLKKRTKHEEIHKIEFIQNVNINSKENKTSVVCKVCYKVIIHELQLIKMEKKLAQICNIIPQGGQELFESENKSLKGNSSLGQYKQWRLMLYFEQIKNSHQLSTKNYARSIYFESGASQKNSKSQPQYFLRYQLCPKICESFSCKKESRTSNNLSINQVKLHYFYSETTNIEDFINNTQIIVSLYSVDDSQSLGKNQKLTDANGNVQGLNNEGSHDRKQLQKFEKYLPTQKLIASGSTHILSSFNLYKSSSFSLKGLMQNGQKQTVTVLLFFQNKKYCELTLKVGLVYDGSYNVNNIPTKRENSAEMENFIKWNEVWFSKNRWNSNPLPKEWMEIFGSKYNYNSLFAGMSNGEEMKEEQNQERMIKKMMENSSLQSSYLDQ